MSGLFARLFPRAPVNGHAGAYETAMAESDDLIAKMRASKNGSLDAVRAVLTDIWQNGHNVPFVTTVFETVQELKSGTDQNPHDVG